MISKDTPNPASFVGGSVSCGNVPSDFAVRHLGMLVALTV